MTDEERQKLCGELLYWQLHRDTGETLGKTLVAARGEIERLANRVKSLETAAELNLKEAALVELEEKVHFWQGEAEKWMKTVQSIDRPPRPDASPTLDEIEAAMDRVLERHGFKTRSGK